ncbi:MAG TPA: DUF87 domain-containing protein [Candidatus Cybelea sp.]|jgi:hypothetical protein|nr:DUF87 domain-containing protein [Candidatus Cybelea sp.]
MLSVNGHQEGTAAPEAGQLLGHITKIGGSQIVAVGECDDSGAAAIGAGALVKINGYRDVIAIVNTIELDVSSKTRVLSLGLIGEITTGPEHETVFQRGVSRYPALGAAVTTVTGQDLLTVYARPSVPSIRVGQLGNNELQSAFVMVDELLAKHFAIVGSTGCGKSCAVTLILSEILANQPNAHVILLDPHNEYTTAFGDLAEVVNVHNARLPFWLLTLEEAERILVRGGTQHEQEVQAMILKDAMRLARQNFAPPGESSAWITVDTPVPFPTHELRRNLREAMGAVNKSDSAGPYRRLEAQLISLAEDRRYAFMFGEEFGAEDLLSDLVGRLLRIPVNGKPITIVDLSGVPSEIADVVVSVTSRVLFDFTLWSDPDRRPPVLLACEEAHRYLPASGGSTFAACTRAISRIAREGRKYGLSLALISQRPSELSPQALSQCGTVFALRLGNDLDQRFIEGALPDTGHMMLGALSSLPAQQAVVFGEAVSLPMHIRFDSLSPEQRPRSQSARFSEAWQSDSVGVAFRDEAIRRWRTRTE